MTHLSINEVLNADMRIEYYFNEDRGRSYTDASDPGRIVWVSGYAFIDGTFYGAKQLAEFLSTKIDRSCEEVIATCKALNGSFAAVIIRGNSCLAIVDRLRSIPLFYSMREGVLRISNEARWIAGPVEEGAVDKQSFNEFYSSGYVAGQRTLLDNVKQIRPGEYLRSDRTRGAITERYYRYANLDLSDESEDALIERLKAAVHNAFSRVISYAGGRTIVIPLSGGIDSRLVAAAIKKIGYDNVICFSYGRDQNWESERSRKIAAALGYKWIFVEYSREKWRSWRAGGEFKKYSTFADNLASLPHLDDWGAVKELKERGVIPKDSIFMPGHTGDFTSSGHLKNVLDATGVVSRDKLVHDIIYKHYSLWPGRLRNIDIARQIEEAVGSSLEQKEVNTVQEMASLYETWEWQERQSKFIVNSVRVYDFWGYDWALPLWDSELMDFWSRVPYRLKVDKKLYLKYLSETDQFGLFGFVKKRNKRAGIMEYIYNKRGNFFTDSLLDFYNTYKKLREYRSNVKGIYGIYKYLVLIQNVTKIRNINSFLVKDYLDIFLKNVKGPLI